MQSMSVAGRAATTGRPITQLKTVGSCRPARRGAAAAKWVVSAAYLETSTVGKSDNIRFHEATGEFVGGLLSGCALTPPLSQLLTALLFVLCAVSRNDKELLLGQRGSVVWFTGE